MPQPIYPLDASDPRLIAQSEEPLLVFADEPHTPIGWLIDFKTHLQGLAAQDHAMLSRTQGKFVVQDMKIFNAYVEIPMDRYLIKGTSLTFVQLVNSNAEFVQAFNDSVDARLNSKWWQKMYDFVGILGQAISCPWIHTPGLRFCSVDVIRHLVNACPKLPKDDQHVINSIPPESNPEYLFKIIVDNPNIFLIKYFYKNIS